MTQQISNLDERVRESLRDRIISGELAGGAHLSELKISKDFNVSRTPVREALCALAADGLIEMVPHRGAFVKTIDQNAQQDQQFVYGQLMGLATRMAAERAGIESLMALESSVNGMKDLDVSNFSIACMEVNTLIREAAQSETLNGVIQNVERRMITNPFRIQSAGQMEEVYQQYTYLMGAFKRKKADSAEKTMRDIMALLGNAQTTEAQSEQIVQPSEPSLAKEGLNA